MNPSSTTAHCARVATYYVVGVPVGAASAFATDKIIFTPLGAAFRLMAALWEGMGKKRQ